MFNLIGRFFRVIFHYVTLGVVKLEKNTASQRREALIDEKTRQVADARQRLGILNGQGRTQTRRVNEAEKSHKAILARKEHFMNLLKSADPNSAHARDAEAKARQCHLQLKAATEDLNRERNELAVIHREYEMAKALVRTAEATVQEAKRTGERLARAKESASRRNELLETTASLQGLGGLGDELTAMDRQLREEIDQLEGSAFNTAEHMADQLAERHLDLEIAQDQAEDEFEQELNAMRAASGDGNPVQSLPEPSSERVIDVPATREPEPVQADFGGGSDSATRTVRTPDFGGSDFGGSSYGSSDSGSSDSGGGSSD